MGGGHRWRQAVAWAAVTLAAVLVPLVIAAYWVSNTLLDTERYVATMAPLAENRQFTDALAGQLTDVLYKALPAGARSSPEATAARSTVRAQAAAALAAPTFPPLWDEANRKAQQQAVAVFTHRKTPGVSTTKGLTIDLTPVVAQMLPALDRSHVTLFDNVLPTVVAEHRAQVTVLTAEQLAEARSLFGFLIDAKWYLSAAAAVLLVGGLVLGSRRWVLVWGFLLATAVTVGLSFGALAVARSAVSARAAPLGVDRSLSVSVFDTVDRYLRSDLVIAGVSALGLAVVLALVVLLRRRSEGRV